MNPRQIEAFRAIAQAGTVTAAAERLNISQPAVSRLLADLEHRTGLALFARAKGRLHLTPEGAAFLRHVDRHFVGLDELDQAARRIAAHGPEDLRILGFPSITSSLLPLAIARHLVKHPSTRVSLDTDTTDQIAAHVASGNFDLGFTAGQVAGDAPVETRAIASRPWLCVLPQNHPLASVPSLETAILKDEPLIGFSPGISLRTNVDRLLLQAGVEPAYQITARTIESICALVSEWRGGAIIHPYATRVAQKFGLHTAVLADAPSLDLIALTPEPPWRKRIVEQVIQDIESILARQAETKASG